MAGVIEQPQSAVLSVVVPCFNEEEVLGRLYRELKAVLISLRDLEHEIVFVDDGSVDGTLELLKSLSDQDESVKVFSFSRNFGHQVALTAGLDQATGDAVVFMDADLQHPPALIERLVELWHDGFDIVSTIRTQTLSASWLKRSTAALFYRGINLLSDTPIVRGAADFCLLSRPACDALRAMPERHRFLRGMISWIGFRRTFVEFEAPARVEGKSKYSWNRMVALAYDALFSFSVTPIRLAGRLGFLVTALGCIYLTYVVLRHVLIGDLVPGWGSTISTVLILGGIQLTFIGLIGQYLARLYEEAKGRPLYVFKYASTDSEPATTGSAVKRVRADAT